MHHTLEIATFDPLKYAIYNPIIILYGKNISIVLKRVKVVQDLSTSSKAVFFKHVKK